MGEKILMKGNEAIGEGAVRAGCQAYFGYPITPQSELLEYMAAKMPQLGRVFLQAESEVAAINMVFGAAAAGVRAMTSSSGPGISLKQEGISFLAGAELPAVIVNVMRAGPGLGGIAPAQGDYFQATKGGGHGDYHPIVLAPSSVQEAMDLTALAFDLADKYRNPTIVLADGLIGQVMEPVELRKFEVSAPPKPWALTGAKGRERNVIRSINLEPEQLEVHIRHLERKYAAIRSNEVRYTQVLLDDAEIVVVAYGIMARVARTAIKWARQEGIVAGLFRPISLYPFPYAPLTELAQRVRVFLVLELSMGQMLEDVQLAVGHGPHVAFVNRLGGVVLSAEEALESLRELATALREITPAVPTQF
ncbi:MAG: 3-methyl-2-oxobutanoate dehydrogenase subunit VorB [Chloroflexi bacterium]|nr:3-methyl-2-oxobutanoate dehydrogenase subunit VorB [Chloroflexota bacterium]MCL5074328.1 3-methyl-2-oxobutanoate dehydrogenase subunit VorB [Chloroflexota bacterium]